MARRREPSFFPALLARTIAYLFVVGMSGLSGWLVIDALVTGETVLRRSRVMRTEDPVSFWMAVAFGVAVSGFFLFVLGKGAIRDVKRLMAS
jgi:hypothetical protein